jgi:ABC-2 type transport system permease protein
MSCRGIVVLLLLAFSYVFSWISATIGLSVRSVEVANSAGFVWMFPLTFVSNVFVSPDTMPTPFRIFAEWNPISALVGAARELFGNTPERQGLSPEELSQLPPEDLAMAQVAEETASTAWPLQNPIPVSLFWMAVILAIFIPFSIRQYKGAASR